MGKGYAKNSGIALITTATKNSVKTCSILSFLDWKIFALLAWRYNYYAIVYFKYEYEVWDSLRNYMLDNNTLFFNNST